MFNFVPSYFKMLGPKLKFYLFPLTRQTLKNALLKQFYFNFQSRILFLNFIETRENRPINRVILAFVYLICLPIVGLNSKICLKRPLKDILKGRKDKWALNAARKYCRILPGSILQYFCPVLSDVFFLSGLLRQGLLFTIKLNGHPI